MDQNKFRSSSDESERRKSAIEDAGKAKLTRTQMDLSEERQPPIARSLVPPG